MTNASGCDSVINLNLTINNSFHDVDSVNGCEGYLWSFNSQLYTQSGTYYDTLTTVNGCDSSMTLHLTLDSINTSVSQSGATLTALNTSSTATFQWLDCDNSFTPITGADSSSFTPAVNGNYAVLILDNGCADTSACYEVNNVGLEGGFALSSISVFPNPTTGDYQVDFGRAYNKVRITVTDLAGKVLEKHHLENSQSFNSTLDGPKGMYMIWIQTEYRKQQVFRIVKD
ncbi:MAG TPA: hypothetical protein DCG19_15320 [Cryomorphaceae bacterium]|nr:hypothetical protein [Cryomorphaceae bacterium]